MIMCETMAVQNNVVHLITNFGLEKAPTWCLMLVYTFMEVRHGTNSDLFNRAPARRIDRYDLNDGEETKRAYPWGHRPFHRSIGQSSTGLHIARNCRNLEGPQGPSWLRGCPSRLGQTMIMANPILLDTDVLVDFLRGHNKAVVLVNAYSYRIILSSIVIAELYAGIKGLVPAYKK